MLLMRKFALYVTLFCPLSFSHQQKPELDMGKMQMIFLNLAPDAATQSSAEQKNRIDDLLTSGRLVLAGDCEGPGSLRQILVMNTESIAEAREMADSLPLVKSGVLKPDVLSWYAARSVIKRPQLPLSRTDYIFGILVRGPKWTPEETEETKKIQEGHMSNINRLAEMGKLVLAGPFFDADDRRGVFIFKVSSVDEAQTLTDTDPAVKAGRLRIQLYRWSIPKGILP